VHGQCLPSAWRPPEVHCHRRVGLDGSQVPRIEDERRNLHQRDVIQYLFHRLGRQHQLVEFEYRVDCIEVLGGLALQAFLSITLGQLA